MWPNTQETVDLVTFTEEISKGKLHFLCSCIPMTKILDVIDSILQKIKRPGVESITDHIEILWMLNSIGRTMLELIKLNLIIYRKTAQV